MKARHRVVVDPELVGPEEAREMLKDLRPDYRAADMQSVHEFAKAMRNGQWRPRRGNLMVDNDNGLVDGRRRLLAVIECGLHIEFVVLRGKFDLLREEA